MSDNDYMALGQEEQPINSREHVSLADKALSIGALGVVAAEVTPANESIRLLAAGFAQAVNGDPAVVAATLAGATLIIEGGAALATAHLLDKEGGKKATGWINNKLGRFSLEGRNTNIPAEASVAYLGGSAVVMLMKKLQNPDMDKAESRKYGLRAAAGLASILGIQGYFLSQGIDTPDPSTIALAVGSVGAPIYAAQHIISKNKKTQKNHE